jgi:hypothetical protein
MVRVRSNNKKTDSASSAALIEIARLLARQAAHEWSAQQPDINDTAPPHHRSGERS